MPDLGPEALSDKRQLVVVLRLVTSPTGRLLYGEVIDPDAGPSGRFVGWRGMTPAVRAWLSRDIARLGGLTLFQERDERDPQPIEH